MEYTEKIKMKLNPDCIRDILLYLEENLSYTNSLISMEHNEIAIHKVISDVNNKYSYTKEDIQYSIEKLLEIKFIVVNQLKRNNNGYIIFGNIFDITWDGHNFLNNVRPKSVWEATKKGASKIGLMSIHSLNMISSKVIDKIISDSPLIDKIINSIGMINL